MTNKHQRRKAAMSDTKRFEWLLRHLEWDGYGYWFPERCVKERDGLAEYTPEPTLAELRQWIDDQLQPNTPAP